MRRVRDLSHRLASEEEAGRLLPLILDAAIELSHAERGFLVLVRGHSSQGQPKIKVEVARGFDQEALRGGAKQISKTVVGRVLEREGRGLVTTSEDDGDVILVPSVQARRVLAIACVPLRLRGETLGLLYLDHRFCAPPPFTPDHLPLLASFADQAALALAAAKPAAAPQEAPSAQAAPPPRGGPRSLGKLLGGSPPMQALYTEIERAAQTPSPVLILGEPGSGKSLVAEEMHARSPGAHKPLSVVTCGGGRGGGLLPFGAEAVLLNEVGALNPEQQVELLHILETIERGERKLRLFATSQNDLRDLVAAGSFRPELYYRLDVLRLVVPPLRQRSGDVQLLAEAFLARSSQRPPLLSPKGLELLRAYAWPGNVRQLENEARRLLLLGERRLSSKHLSEEIRQGRGVSRLEGSLSGKTLSEVEREMVAGALRDCQGNKARAARQLEIPRSTLYHLLERYGLGG